MARFLLKSSSKRLHVTNDACRSPLIQYSTSGDPSHEARHRHHQALQARRRQRGHTELYRGAEYVVDFLPKIRIDIAVTDDAVDTVIEAVLASARTGKVGDGKIFVSPLEHVVRIRTGEEDEGAI